MGKLYLRNFLVGMIFVGISAAFSAAIIALFSLFSQAVNIPFSAIPAYIVGGVIGVVCCFIFKRLLIEKNGYFLREEIDDPQKKSFWIQCIRNKKFIGKRAARATYIPSFVISAAIIVLAGVLYPTLQNAGEMSSYVGYSIICAVIGAAAFSLIMYGIFGLMSIKVCDKCGAVNAFIYDEYLGFDETSVFTGESYNSAISHHGMGWGGGGYNTSKISTSESTVSRHCACCNEKSSFTESPNGAKALFEESDIDDKAIAK